MVLPEAVMEWAGLAINNPDVEYDDGEVTSLATLNDGVTDAFRAIILERTHAEISALIRTQL